MTNIVDINGKSREADELLKVNYKGEDFIKVRYGKRWEYYPLMSFQFFNEDFNIEKLKKKEYKSAFKLNDLVKVKKEPHLKGVIEQIAMDLKEIESILCTVRLVTGANKNHKIIYKENELLYWNAETDEEF